MKANVRFLVLTEDSGKQGQPTIQILTRAALRLVKPNFDSRKLELSPLLDNPRASAALRGNAWKDRRPSPGKLQLLGAIATCRHRRAGDPVPPRSPRSRGPAGGSCTVLRPDRQRIGRAGPMRSRSAARSGSSLRSSSCALSALQVSGFRKPFPSMMKRSDRSVSLSAITCALSASGNTFVQSLKMRLVVMQVERRWSYRSLMT